MKPKKRAEQEAKGEKAKEAKMKTTQTIDSDIHGERQRVEVLQKVLGEKKNELETLDQKREELTYLANAQGNAEAQTELKAARTARMDKALEVEEIERALVQAKEKLEVLERDRQEAYRAETWAECLKEAEAAEEEAKVLDEITQMFCRAVIAHRRRLGYLQELAFESGRPREASRFESGMKHFWRSFRAHTYKAGVEIEDTASIAFLEIYRDRTYAEIWQSSIENMKRNGKPEGGGESPVEKEEAEGATS